MMYLILMLDLRVDVRGAYKSDIRDASLDGPRGAVDACRVDAYGLMRVTGQVRDFRPSSFPVRSPCSTLAAAAEHRRRRLGVSVRPERPARAPQREPGRSDHDLVVPAEQELKAQFGILEHYAVAALVLCGRPPHPLSTQLA